jgi:hypothetical protein
MYESVSTGGVSRSACFNETCALLGARVHLDLPPFSNFTSAAPLSRFPEQGLSSPQAERLCSRWSSLGQGVFLSKMGVPELLAEPRPWSGEDASPM